jgi:hypothetical protein
MTNKTIPNLGAITVPLAGTEVIPIWNGSATNYVSVANLTVGRAVATGNLTVTGTSSVTTNTEAAATQAVASGTNATLYQFTNGGGTYSLGVDRSTGGYFGSAYAFGISVPAGRTVRHVVNGTPITITSATGHEVTGLTKSSDNFVPTVSGKGIDFSAVTAAAGMTSKVLSNYEEGTWTPMQGAGVTVVGTYSSSAKYIRIGKQVTVTGMLAGSTSIACTAVSALLSGLPFVADYSNGYQCGTATNYTADAGYVLHSYNLTLYAITAIAATPFIYFSFTYLTT